MHIHGRTKLGFFPLPISEAKWKLLEKRRGPMREQNSQRDRLPLSIPVIPLPVALYVSDSLIFELYDGGQPYRPLVIRWERLRPTVPVTEENT
jgi:hypothetical protein